MADYNVLSAKVREGLRDLALLFASAVVTAFIVAGAPWGVAIVPVLWKAGLTAVGAQIVLYLTPLTKRYGAFKEKHALLEEHLEKLPV